ncbi:HDOD domain-containing protein [Thioalkalivibrio sp. XN8]|uniref:HDOD domain-containing protein n=1 Tax=Thioalkalivibrio sp. XN8 TaxID=2712863 RepID=UPI0013EB791D|nr:HDOD domain-containing protein [Thioalkalivibrio sp. XN8]NGP53869.1 HDOD domain-containing protein [Thioalkalivibrio sp. XN8]
MTSHQEAFAIVQNLAGELSKGQVELPSLPVVVMRLRNELAQSGFDVPRLAHLAATEPVLAGSILTMANSVACRRAGSETLDLKIAITRIGADKVQALAWRFAMRQLKQNSDLGACRDLLEEEWSLGLRIAAACHLIAERSGDINPDEALVVGLIHNVGRIYLLSRADAHPALFESPAVLSELLDMWHVSIGQAIVESWHLPEVAVEAVAAQADEDDGRHGSLTYVLRIALALAASTEVPTPEELEAVAQWRACRTLKLDAGDLGAIAEGHETTRVELGLID